MDKFIDKICKIIISNRNVELPIGDILRIVNGPTAQIISIGHDKLIGGPSVRWCYNGMQMNNPITTSIKHLHDQYMDKLKIPTNNWMILK